MLIGLLSVFESRKGPTRDLDFSDDNSCREESWHSIQKKRRIVIHPHNLDPPARKAGEEANF